MGAIKSQVYTPASGCLMYETQAGHQTFGLIELQRIVDFWILCAHLPTTHYNSVQGAEAPLSNHQQKLLFVCKVLRRQGLTTLLQYTHGYIIMHHLIFILGHLSSEMFVQLLEGKANFLKGCGITVTMPSAEALAQGSPDIIDRFQAIEMVDLSGMGNLAGELRGPKASPKERSRNFLQSHHYHVHLPPLDFQTTLTPSRTASSHR